MSPTETNSRLRITLVLAANVLEVTDGAESLGAWSFSEVEVARSNGNLFALRIDDEDWQFLPDSPTEFLFYAVPAIDGVEARRRMSSRLPRDLPQLADIGRIALGAAIAVFLLAIGLLMGRYRVDNSSAAILVVLAGAAGIGAWWTFLQHRRDTSAGTPPPRAQMPVLSEQRRSALNVRDVIARPEVPEPGTAAGGGLVFHDGDRDAATSLPDGPGQREAEPPGHKPPDRRRAEPTSEDAGADVSVGPAEAEHREDLLAPASADHDRDQAGQDHDDDLPLPAGQTEPRTDDVEPPDAEPDDVPTPTTHADEAPEPAGGPPGDGVATPAAETDGVALEPSPIGDREPAPSEDAVEPDAEAAEEGAPYEAEIPEEELRDDRLVTAADISVTGSEPHPAAEPEPDHQDGAESEAEHPEEGDFVVPGLPDGVPKPTDEERAGQLPVPAPDFTPPVPQPVYDLDSQAGEVHPDDDRVEQDTSAASLDPAASVADLIAETAETAEPRTLADTTSPAIGEETPLDLTMIRGIGPALSAALTELGVADVRDIAVLESDDLDYLQRRLGRFATPNRTRQWVTQARRIVAEHEADEHPPDQEPAETDPLTEPASASLEGFDGPTIDIILERSSERHEDDRLEQDTSAASLDPAASVADLIAETAETAEPRTLADTTSPANGEETPLDLTMIRGIGPALSAALTELGVADVRDIAVLDSDDLDYLQRRLGRFATPNRTRQWVTQARRIIAEHEADEHPPDQEPAETVEPY